MNFWQQCELCIGLFKFDVTEIFCNKNKKISLKYLFVLFFRYFKLRTNKYPLSRVVERP